MDKLNFLLKEVIPLLVNLKADDDGVWGKMNGQQMVEHVAAFFQVSTGKLQFPLITPAEQLPKYKAFLLSDKTFRENTKAPVEVVPEDPLPIHHASQKEAIEALEKEINYFVKFFKENPTVKTLHPSFGELDFEEWVILHHKHITHHLKQFGLL